MSPPFPKDPSDVPWKKVRTKFAEVLRYMRRVRPIPGNGLEVTPTGFRIQRPDEDQKFIPQFHPTTYLNGTTRILSMNPGYVHCPVSTQVGEQHAGCAWFPFTPDVGSFGNAMTDDPRPTLSMTANETWVIAVKVVSEERNQRIGDSGQGGDELEVLMPLEGGTPHDHSSAGGAGAYLEAKNYSLDENSAPPLIEAHTETAFYALQHTNVTKYRPIGRYVLDSDGGIVSRAWYVEGHIDLVPEDAERGSSADTQPGNPTKITKANFPLPTS